MMKPCALQRALFVGHPMAKKPPPINSQREMKKISCENDFFFNVIGKRMPVSTTQNEAAHEREADIV